LGIFRVTGKFSLPKPTLNPSNPFPDCFWAAAKFSRLPHAPPNLSATPLGLPGGCYAFAISLNPIIFCDRPPAYGIVDIALTIEKVRYEESDRTL